MRLIGHISKQGKYWAADVAGVGVHTQGTSQKDAREMIADAIEELVNERGFKVRVEDLGDGDVAVTANDQAVFAAFILRAKRTASGLSLAEVAERLGEKSRTVYARYESGRSTPSVEKFAQLLAAVDPKSSITVA